MPTLSIDRAQELEQVDITSPALYAAGYPWEAFETLRREAPVYWYQRPGFEPFWAITKHEDIAWIERNPEIFSNAKAWSFGNVDYVEQNVAKEHLRRAERGCPAEPSLLRMDPPVHRKFRSITSRRFTARLINNYEAQLTALAEAGTTQFMSTLESANGEPINFVYALADRLPVAAICSMLGIPEEDWRRIEHWVDARVDPMDEEFHRDGLRYEEIVRLHERDYETYLERTIRSRRDAPQDDLTTILLEATVDGRPLTEPEILAYMFLLFVAGNETTRSSIALGVDALLRHPAELEKLQRNPALIPLAVEEMFRWTSVLVQFSRLCLQDVEIRGQRIRRGEPLVLFYPSANRDEDVFDDPQRFDISRDPNPHMAFGSGEHYCLGVNLARLEMRTIFQALLPVLPNLELAGRPVILPNLTLHVAKNVPVRLR